MNLPAFDIPIPPLGFDIPVLMHPPVVHFAIVLPIVILLLELINLIMKRRGLTITAITFFIFLMLIYAAAYITGKTDGSEAYDMLTRAGQADLKAHKLIGTYLMLGTVVLFFLKLFSMALRAWWMKLLYMLALIGFVAAVFYQGKEGGELVYKYGANNEQVMELSNQIDDLNDELEELKEESGKSDEATESTEEEEAPAAAPAPEKPEKAEPEVKKPANEEEPPATEASTESKEETAPPATESTESPAAETEKSETTAPATESSKEESNTSSATEAVKEKVQEAAQNAADTVNEATQDVKDAAGNAVDKAKEMISGQTE